MDLLRQALNRSQPDAEPSFLTQEPSDTPLLHVDEGSCTSSHSYRQKRLLSSLNPSDLPVAIEGSSRDISQLGSWAVDPTRQLVEEDEGFYSQDRQSLYSFYASASQGATSTINNLTEHNLSEGVHNKGKKNSSVYGESDASGDVQLQHEFSRSASNTPKAASPSFTNDGTWSTLHPPFSVINAANTSSNTLPVGYGTYLKNYEISSNGLIFARQGRRALPSNKKRDANPSRTYSCKSSGCAKAFQYPKDLRRHNTSHTHDKNFACVCGKSYTREDNLKRHQSGCKFLLPKEDVELNDAVEHGQSSKDGYHQQTSGLLFNLHSSATGNLKREQSAPSEIFSQKSTTRSHDNRKSTPGFEGKPLACPEWRYQLSPLEHRCNQPFKDESRLDQHKRRIHDQFDCIKCHDPFLTKEEWSNHRKERPHHCNKCSTCMTEDEKRWNNHQCDTSNKRLFKFKEEVWQYLYERHYSDDKVKHSPHYGPDHQEALFASARARGLESRLGSTLRREPAFVNSDTPGTYNSTTFTAQTTPVSPSHGPETGQFDSGSNNNGSTEANMFTSSNSEDISLELNPASFFPFTAQDLRNPDLAYFGVPNSHSLQYNQLVQIILAQGDALKKQDDVLKKERDEKAMLWSKIHELQNQVANDNQASHNVLFQDNVMGRGKRPAPEYSDEQRLAIRASRQRTDKGAYIGSFPLSSPLSDDTSTLSLSSASYTTPEKATSGMKHPSFISAKEYVQSDDEVNDGIQSQSAESLIDWDEQS